jgi:hypothetical protein
MIAKLQILTKRFIAALRRSPLWIETKTGLAEFKMSWTIAGGNRSRLDRNAPEQRRQERDDSSVNRHGNMITEW